MEEYKTHTTWNVKNIPIRASSSFVSPAVYFCATVKPRVESKSSLVPFFSIKKKRKYLDKCELENQGEEQQKRRFLDSPTATIMNRVPT